MSIFGHISVDLDGQQQQQLFVPINSDETTLEIKYCPSNNAEEGNKFRLLVKRLGKNLCFWIVFHVMLGTLSYV